MRLCQRERLGPRSTGVAEPPAQSLGEVQLSLLNAEELSPQSHLSQGLARPLWGSPSRMERWALLGPGQFHPRGWRATWVPSATVQCGSELPV